MSATTQADVELAPPAVAGCIPAHAAESVQDAVGRHRHTICTLLAVGFLLLVSLLPASFSYLEYYEYGLLQRKSTGQVRVGRVYSAGRYLNGPDWTFRKYQADTHRLDFDELSVFSAGATNNSVGLEFQIDVTLTYMLDEEAVGLIHEQLGAGYAKVVESRARAAIKNVAASVAFDEYFQERDRLESRLFAAVEGRLVEPPSLHAHLDQLVLGRVQIPSSVAQKQLDVKVQLERNDEQTNLKAAQLERDQTDVMVNKINLQAVAALRIANANAKLTSERGAAEARDIIERAKADGLALALTRTGLTADDHKASYDYLRTVAARAQAGSGSDSLSVTYLHPNAVTPTSDADAD